MIQTLCTGLLPSILTQARWMTAREYLFHGAKSPSHRTHHLGEHPCVQPEPRLSPYFMAFAEFFVPKPREITNIPLCPAGVTPESIPPH